MFGKAIESWGFAFWEAFLNYCLNLLTGDESNWILYFFMIQSWKVVWF